jgi:hypothetical protein
VYKKEQATRTVARRLVGTALMVSSWKSVLRKLTDLLDRNQRNWHYCSRDKRDPLECTNGHVRRAIVPYKRYIGGCLGEIGR